MEKQKRTKPKFDIEEIGKIFTELTDNGKTQGEVITKIVTRWRRGELKRIEANNEDIGVNKRHFYESKIIKVLLMTGRFRPNFTGKLEFEVTTNEGTAKKVHYQISNYII